MNTKKKIIVGIIVLLIILLPTITKAGIESKPGTTAWTKISVSDAYGLCYELNSGGSTLGDCNLDPHLILNKDWGAVAYLAISSYGAVTDRTGPTTSINGTSGYYTTTGNATGVINLGKTKYTYTSSSIASGLQKGSSNNQYRTNLIKNANTRYVETLPDSGKQTAETTKGMAIVETSGWFTSASNYEPSSYYPMGLRFQGVIGYFLRRRISGMGGSSSDATFRPVIWNIER